MPLMGVIESIEAEVLGHPFSNGVALSEHAGGVTGLTESLGNRLFVGAQMGALAVAKPILPHRRMPSRAIRSSRGVRVIRWP